MSQAIRQPSYPEDHSDKPSLHLVDLESATERFPAVSDDTVVMPSLRRLNVGSTLGQGVLRAERQQRNLSEGRPEWQDIGAVPVELAGDNEIGDFAAQAVQVRSALTSLNETQRTTIEPHLADCAARTFQGRHALLPGDRGDKPWSQWLPEASDEILVDFMAAHLSLLREQVQSPAFSEAVAAGKNSFIRGVRRFIDEDILHPEAEAAIDAIKDTDVLLGDYWDTYVQGAAGYHYEGGDNYIVLAQGVGGSQGEAESNLAGMTPLLVQHEGGHLKFAHKLPRWRKEATVHHLAVSCEYGEIDIMDPQKRTVRDRYYEEERTLMHTLHTQGLRSVSVASLMRSATAQESFDQEDLAYRKALDEAWGLPDTLERIDRYIVEQEAWLRTKHPKHTDRMIQTEALKAAVRRLEEYAVALPGSGGAQATTS